jgi:hypothetical protein
MKKKCFLVIGFGVLMIFALNFSISGDYVSKEAYLMGIPSSSSQIIVDDLDVEGSWSKNTAAGITHFWGYVGEGHVGYRLTDASGSNYGSLERTFDSFTSGVMSFDLNITTMPSSQDGIELRIHEDSASNKGVCIHIWSDTLYNYVGSSYLPFGSYGDLNTWYHFDISFETGAGAFDGLSADTFNVYIDSVLVGSDLDFQSSRSYLNHPNFGIGGSPTGEFSIDNYVLSDNWVNNDEQYMGSFLFGGEPVDSDFNLTANYTASYSALSEDYNSRVLKNDTCIGNYSLCTDCRDSTHMNSTWRDEHKSIDDMVPFVTNMTSVDSTDINLLIIDDVLIINGSYIWLAVSSWDRTYVGDWGYDMLRLDSILLRVLDGSLSVVSTSSIIYREGSTKTKFKTRSYEWVYNLGGMVFEWLSKYGLYALGGLVGTIGAQQYVKRKLTDGVIRTRKEISRTRLWRKPKSSLDRIRSSISRSSIKSYIEKFVGGK